MLWLAFAYPVVGARRARCCWSLLMLLAHSEGLARSVRRARRRVARTPAPSPRIRRAERRSMFDKILIANRGEIACRVARTARRLGDPDRRRLLRRRRRRAARRRLRRGVADRRRRRRARATSTATRSSRSRRRTGAQAIHPGYGFLSENEEFAAACARGRHRLHRPAAGGDRARWARSPRRRRSWARPACRSCPATTATTRIRRCSRARRRRIGYPVLIKATRRRRRQGHEDRRARRRSSPRRSRRRSARRRPRSATTACCSRAT